MLRQRKDKREILQGSIKRLQSHLLCRVFHLLWALHLGLMLLLPKLLHEWELDDRLRQAIEEQPIAAVEWLLKLLMSPLLNLCSMASMPSVWLPQVMLCTRLWIVHTRLENARNTWE